MFSELKLSFKGRGYLVNRVRVQTQSFISVVYKSLLKGVLD